MKVNEKIAELKASIDVLLQKEKEGKNIEFQLSELFLDARDWKSNGNLYDSTMQEIFAYDFVLERLSEMLNKRKGK